MRTHLSVTAEAAVHQPNRSEAFRTPARIEPRARWQRTLGNLAVQRLIHHGLLQPKLLVNPPHDPLELEAESVADRVAAPLPTSPDLPSGQSEGHAVSKFATGARPDETPPSELMLSEAHRRALPDDVQATLRAPGHPLDPPLRRDFEARLGVSLDAVRLHTHESAARSAASLQAQAYTVGRDIVFGAGQYMPTTQHGRRLLAHELAHVRQQLSSGGARGSPSALIQCQDQNAPAPSPNPPAREPSFTIVPWSSQLSATETPDGLVLTYLNTRQIHLNAAAAPVPRQRAISYQFMPRTLQREYAIIRIVVAPGVGVRKVGFSAESSPSFSNPLVEIIRVQDPELVPRQGETIDPAAYAGSKLAQPTDDPSRPAAGFPHQVLISREANGVDISHLESHVTLRIRVPSGAADARFAYQVQLGEKGFLPRDQPTVVTVTKTRSVEVSLIGMTRGKSPTDFLIHVFNVDNIAQVPPQGAALSEQGERTRPVVGELDETLEQTLAMASADTGIGLIPVVGELADIAEFAYGLATGRDRWGRKVGAVDLAMMGLGALLPFVSGGLVRGAGKVGRASLEAVAKAIGRNADDAGRLLRGLGALSEAELAQLRRWDDLVRRGERIPAGELEAARRLLAVVGRSVPGEGATAGAGRAVRDLLNEGGTGFRTPELQEAYRHYLSQVAQQPGVSPLSPLEWARSSAGRPRALIGAFLGPHAEAVEFATNASDYLAAVRREAGAGGGVGRSWDWARFGELPPGEKWRPGDPINMPDLDGKYPDYNNVARGRYWKNRAFFEQQAREAGTAADATALDPVRRMNKAELESLLSSGHAPADPSHAGRVMELEHTGVPQRVVKMISALGGDFARDARQLAEVSDPRFLLESTPLEHAFHDTFAHSFHPPGRPPVVNPRRADAAGRAWKDTDLGDLRPGRPLGRMSDGNLLQLIERARREAADFNRTPATRQLRDAINSEIQLRGLQVTPFQ